MLKERIFKLNQIDHKGRGPIVYWMSRDQRVKDNWALIAGLKIAQKKQLPFWVIFCLHDQFPGANARHFAFMLGGLEVVESNLAKLGIPFYLLRGEPVNEVQSFIGENQVSMLFTDFDPLRIKQSWKEKLGQSLSIPFLEVDAHNIVPCRKASDKLEFGAYTIRPKINRLISTYLEQFPELEKQTFMDYEPQKINWAQVYAELDVDRSVQPVNWILPGEEKAILHLHKFIEHFLDEYHLKRNDPTEDGCSNLSPYLHFGHISAQRVAIEVLKSDNNEEAKSSFLEELIVRRELSDNYCFYNKEYDSFEGFPQWAKTTLNEHRSDERAYQYTIETFENSKTHESLWNAAQDQLKMTGKMHGYLRMYWAKKILEWSISPEEALKISLYLNDKYSLDGRDPNGYVGCAWSIGGVHDRAWNQHAVYGKIRYMNESGCKRKFNVLKFIQKYHL